MGYIFHNALIKESFYNPAPSGVIKSKPHQQEEAALEQQAWWNHSAQRATGQALLGYRGFVKIWPGTLKQQRTILVKHLHLLGSHCAVRDKEQEKNYIGSICLFQRPMGPEQKMDPPKGLKSIGMVGLPGSEVREGNCEEEHLSRGRNKG